MSNVLLELLLQLFDFSKISDVLRIRSQRLWLGRRLLLLEFSAIYFMLRMVTLTLLNQSDNSDFDENSFSSCCCISRATSR